MCDKLVELELRAEILPALCENIKKQLTTLGQFCSHTKRLSVMYFSSVGDKKIDVRVRVTNGECEVVVKLGAFGSHDRVEVFQKIDAAEFLGMVKIFSQFGFLTKIGERETLNYSLPDNIIVSIVWGGSAAYVELEKMSSRSDVDSDKKKLMALADTLGLRLINTETEFESLCRRLTESVDWLFHGTNKEYARLEKLLDIYLPLRNK